MKESEEHQLVREFCDSAGMPKLSEVRETFQRYILTLTFGNSLYSIYVLIVFKQFHRCCELNCVNVVFLLGQELNKEPSDTDSAMRAMLLLEPLLRSDIVKPEVLMMIDE